MSNSESTGARTAVECGDCDSPISPGDTRFPSADGPLHEFCTLKRDAQNTYRFFIHNPPGMDTYSQSLFYDAGDKEYPFLQNTGGLNSVMSAGKTVGDDGAIRPSEHFFPAIAYTYHWLQSYRPLPTDTDRIRDEIDSEAPQYYPNEKIPAHERWAIHLIVTRLYLQRTVPPEFEPIVKCCDAVTKFSVPAVNHFNE